MNFRYLLTLNAVLFFAFGAGFALIPSNLLRLYGILPEPGTIVLAHGYAGLLIAVALLSWLFGRIVDAAAHRALQLSFMIAFAINTLFSLQATLTGAMNAMGWTAVVVYLLLTAGYAYFYFRMPGETKG